MVDSVIRDSRAEPKADAIVIVVVVVVVVVLVVVVVVAVVVVVVDDVDGRELKELCGYLEAFAVGSVSTSPHSQACSQ